MCFAGPGERADLRVGDFVEDRASGTLPASACFEAATEGGRVLHDLVYSAIPAPDAKKPGMPGSFLPMIYRDSAQLPPKAVWSRLSWAFTPFWLSGTNVPASWGR